MNKEGSLNNIDSLLFQLALQTRELSQKKNEIDQQIKVCRANIAERRSYIDTVSSNIKKLEEEISAMQNTVMQIKVNAKSMKATNSLLLLYEQTLKAELESRKNSYNNDLEVYEERISSCRITLKSHKECYFQNPLAQELLALQAEKEEIERRIQAFDDHVTIKQKELDLLTSPAGNSVSTETPPDSQQPVMEEEHFTKEDSDSSIDISSLHLSQSGHKTSVEANAEEVPEQNQVQDSPTRTSPEKASEEQWSCEQSQPDEMHSETRDQETSQEDQVKEQQPTVLGLDDAPLDEMQGSSAEDEEHAPNEDDPQGAAEFPQTSSQGAIPQANPLLEKTTAVPSTPTFAFNFSPSSSPHGGTSDAKSPAFLFSLNSDPSTPGFSGFGFDVGASIDEDSSFAFAGSFFNDKKTTRAKPSSCPEFLFDQPGQSEDFQFAFTAKSPQSANKENTRDEFPFSFNF